MNLFTNHRNHLAVILVAVAAAMVFGWGVGAVAAVAILGCVAMIGAVLWLVAADSRRRSDDRDYQHQ